LLAQEFEDLTINHQPITIDQLTLTNHSRLVPPEEGGVQKAQKAAGRPASQDSAQQAGFPACRLWLPA